MMANLELLYSNVRQAIDALLVNLPQQTPPTVRTTPRHNLKRGRSR
jgi:hypothetical protein